MITENEVLCSIIQHFEPLFISILLGTENTHIYILIQTIFYYSQNGYHNIQDGHQI